MERRFVQVEGDEKEQICISVAKRDKRGFLKSVTLPPWCDSTNEEYYDITPYTAINCTDVILLGLDALVMEAGEHGTPIDI